MSKKKLPFSEDKAEDSSGFLLWQVTTLWQRGIKKVLDTEGITHPQFVLLASILWLHSKNEEVTQILLSNHTQIDPMTTSTVIRNLLTKGLINRKEHKTDTRAKTVVLTDSGEKVITTAIKKVEQFDLEFFSVLGKSVPKFNKKMLKLLENRNALVY